MVVTGCVAFGPIAQPVQRMGDGAAVKQPKDRPPKPDKSDCALCVTGLIEQLARTAVVEQDLAIAIAGQHARGQLGEQRGQQVMLLFQIGSGLIYLSVAVGQQ